MVSVSEYGPSRVYAITVIFNPDLLRLKSQYMALEKQVDFVIFVNNGYSSDLSAAICEFSKNGKVIVEQLGGNFGVASAFNKGIDIAIKHGADFVLLLDQDSLPAFGMCAALLDTYRNKTRNGEKIFAVGPRYINYETDDDDCIALFVSEGKIDKTVVSRRHHRPEKCSYLISSGSLLSVKVIEKVGPMLDSLFIDMVDIEWGVRAQSMGYISYVNPKAQLSHIMGISKSHIKIFSKTKSLSLHEPYRYYYMWRNTILLSKKKYLCGALAKYFITGRLRHLMVVMVFGKRRAQTLYYSVKGILHGLLGVDGELESR